MPIKSHIQDGTGSKRLVRVNEQHAMRVTQTIGDVPPVGTVNRLRYYNALLGSTGADSGIISMNVLGSLVAPLTFYIQASVDYDLYISKIVIIFADSAIVHNKFGNVTALTNGWTLNITESGKVTPIISNAKTGGQLLAQTPLESMYGATTTVNTLSNWTGTEDAATVILDIASIIPNGIRIGRGTNDKIEAIVADDLTGLTEFTVRILGYRHYQ